MDEKLNIIENEVIEFSGGIWGSYPPRKKIIIDNDKQKEIKIENEIKEG